MSTDTDLAPLTPRGRPAITPYPGPAEHRRGAGPRVRHHAGVLDRLRDLTGGTFASGTIDLRLDGSDNNPSSF